MLRDPLVNEFDGVAVSIDEGECIWSGRFADIRSVLFLVSMIGLRRCVAVLKGEML